MQITAVPLAGEVDIRHGHCFVWQRACAVASHLGPADHGEVRLQDDAAMGTECVEVWSAQSTAMKAGCGAGNARNKKAHVTVGFNDKQMLGFLVAEARFELATWVMSLEIPLCTYAGVTRL